MQKKLFYLIFSQLLVILQVMLFRMTILTQQSVWETYIEVFSSQSFQQAQTVCVLKIDQIKICKICIGFLLGYQFQFAYQYDPYEEHILASTLECKDHRRTNMGPSDWIPIYLVH